ncbi:MAG: SPOR domain-containing protein [Pseudomonadota bacterium]
MLKFIFWSLLCINAALFAYAQGMLGNFKPSEREPQRIARQMGTDQLQLLTASAAAANAAKPDVIAEPAPAPVDAAPELVACTEIRNVGEREARRLDKLLAPLALGDKLAKEEITVQEISSHMVMIPPLGSKEAADKKAAELQQQGVSNYFIMNESSAAKWAISLGVFKSEAAAKTLLAALAKQGVSGAKIVGRPTATTRLAYRIRGIEADTRTKLDAIAAKFDDLDTRNCK